MMEPVSFFRTATARNFFDPSSQAIQPPKLDQQVLGGMPHDERADLYSLGVLTWVLFTGGMPGSAQPPVQPRPEACLGGLQAGQALWMKDWLEVPGPN